MDRQALLAAYARAIAPEREEYLRQQAVKKARAYTRGMKPEEAERYFEGPAFANVKDAIADARAAAAPDDLVLVTGSIFLIADALA